MIAPGLRADLPTLVMYELGISPSPLTWSLPGKELSSNTIENLIVRLGEDGVPIAFSSALRSAYGSPLFGHALVEVVSPTIAKGPLISPKEAKGKSSLIKQEDEKPEEASFLSKYWWVILGAVLISSFAGSGDTSNEVSGPNSGGSI